MHWADLTAALASGSHLSWVASFSFCGCSLEPVLDPSYLPSQGLWHRQGAALGQGGAMVHAPAHQAEDKAGVWAASVQRGAAQGVPPAQVQGEAANHRLLHHTAKQQVTEHRTSAFLWWQDTSHINSGSLVPPAPLLMGGRGEALGQAPQGLPKVPCRNLQSLNTVRDLLTSLQRRQSTRALCQQELHSLEFAWVSACPSQKGLAHRPKGQGAYAASASPSHPGLGGPHWEPALPA